MSNKIEKDYSKYIFHSTFKHIFGEKNVLRMRISRLKREKQLNKFEGYERYHMIQLNKLRKHDESGSRNTCHAG